MKNKERNVVLHFLFVFFVCSIIQFSITISELCVRSAVNGRRINKIINKTTSANAMKFIHLDRQLPAANAQTKIWYNRGDTPTAKQICVRA